MISILTPTRKRPSNIIRLIESARAMADKPEELQFVFYVDNDDMETIRVLNSRPIEDNISVVVGERIVLSQMWNECARFAKGDILMHSGDDIIFKTKGWDTMIYDAFNASKDKILFIHGEDGHWGSRFGTHGLIHRNWMNTVGYFVPPYFSSDFNDTWLNDVANSLGRRLFLPFETEHMHPLFGKAEMDDTHRERLERHKRDNVGAVYSEKQGERESDAKKLLDFIKAHQ